MEVPTFTSRAVACSIILDETSCTGTIGIDHLPCTQEEQLKLHELLADLI